MPVVTVGGVGGHADTGNLRPTCERGNRLALGDTGVQQLQECLALEVLQPVHGVVGEISRGARRQPDSAGGQEVGYTVGFAGQEAAVVVVGEGAMVFAGPLGSSGEVVIQELRPCRGVHSRGLVDHVVEADDDSVVVAPVDGGRRSGHIDDDATAHAWIRASNPIMVGWPSDWGLKPHDR